MKTYQRILASIGIVLLCIALVLGMLLAVVRSARVQTAAASVVAEQLSRALEARVEVGTLDYKFPNHLLVSSVLVEDQQQDTLLYVDTLLAHADVWRLLTSDTLCIRKVSLEGGYAHLYMQEDSSMNYQFLVDAFRSESSPKEACKQLPFSIQVQDIRFSEIYADYCEWSTYLPEASLHLNELTAHSLDAEIEQLTLYTEHHGTPLDIENLSAHLVVNDTLIMFPKLHLELPQSDIRVAHLAINQADAKRIQAAQLADSATLAHAWAKTSVCFHIDEATLTPSDLAAVVPALKNMRQPWALTAALDGRLDSLEARHLRLQYAGSDILQGNITALGLPRLDSLYVRAQVEDFSVNKATLQDLLSGATGKPVTLPAMLSKLGQVHYRGALEGQLQDLNLRGAFTSALGSIRTDGHAALGAMCADSISAEYSLSCIDFRGTVSTRRFELGKLLGQADMGAIALTVKANGRAGKDEPFRGDICANIDQFTYRDYTYRDIHLDGTLANSIFDGEVHSHDENIQFQFDGLVDFNQEAPLYCFQFRLGNFRMGELHLSDKYAHSNLRLSMHVDMAGARIDDIVGEVQIDSLSFDNKGKQFLVRELTFLSEKTPTQPAERTLRILSDYVNAHATGHFDYSTLPTSVMRCIAKYLPKVFGTERERQLLAARPQNELEFYLYAKNLNEVCDVLELPLSVRDMNTIKGNLSDHDGTLLLQGVAPDLFIGKQHIENLALSIDNRNEQLNLSLFALRHHGNAIAGQHLGDMRLYIAAHASHDTLFTGINWNNPDTVHNGGQLQLSTSFRRYNNRPLITAHIHPSQFLLADSVWTIAESRVIYSAADTAIQVDGFQLASAHQSIYANGIASRNEHDSIYAELKHVDLDYLLGALTNVHNAIYFGGTVTGWATAYGLLSKPMFEANVEMLHGHINGNEVGHVYANAAFDREQKRVLIQGEVLDPRLPYAPSTADLRPATAVFSPDTLGPSLYSLLPASIQRAGRHTAHIDGEVSSGGRWGLYIYPDSVNIAFVNYWVDGILDDLSGYGSGFVDVHGGKRNGKPYTTVALRCKAHEAGLTLPWTGARYFTSDSVFMDSTSLSFPHMLLHDSEGHRVDFDGAITHNGKFDDIDINLTAQAHRALVLDIKEDPSLDFYGRVYANGTATVRGSADELTVSANATSAANSRFTLSLATASNARNNSFIEFVDHSAPLQKDTVVAKKSGMKFTLSLQIGITPEAQVSVLMDKHTGDCLTGRGDGNVRFTYTDFDGNMQMLGSYVLQQGTFGFTFQNIIRREFQIAEGSSVTWTGDPANPDIDVRARYRVTASLKDLFGAETASVTNRSSVPVNCVLSLSEKLENPLIRFGIELPSSDESVASQVRAAINTDEMLMRQVLYLLVFNRFYTPEYLSNQSNGLNETYSLISSTVTGQINSWLGKLTDKFSVGFNFRNDGEGTDASQEYEAEFEIQPVKGLLINGNFGYRYNDISNQPIFGNLDVEYMLTPNGKLRAKAYTHTVDKYSLRQANTVQGVGFVVKHDFNWPSAERREKREKEKQQRADSTDMLPSDTIVTFITGGEENAAPGE